VFFGLDLELDFKRITCHAIEKAAISKKIMVKKGYNLGLPIGLLHWVYLKLSLAGEDTSHGGQPWPVSHRPKQS
jgi:hypothetical protein